MDSFKECYLLGCIIFFLFLFFREKKVNINLVLLVNSTPEDFFFSFSLTSKKEINFSSSFETNFLPPQNIGKLDPL